MLTVKLKVSGWFHEDFDSAWAHPEGLSVAISEGQTVLEMVRRFAKENAAFLKFVCARDDLEFGANVLVVLNGAFVNPLDRSETLLKDGDEVMLLPVVGGG